MEKVKMQAILLLWGLSVGSASGPWAAGIRVARFSGSFYPANLRELSAQVDGFLKEPKTVPAGELLGLVVPHAGYVYSGKTAGTGFSLLRNRDVPLVILIGRSHQATFRGAIIDDRDAWDTPLGKVELDRDLFNALYRQETFHVNHTILDAEHSLEVELPFLQRVLPKPRIFPMLLGEAAPAEIACMAEGILAAVGKRKFLVVASTDLSHYHDLETAQRMDRQLLRLLEDGNPDVLRDRLARREVEMCGEPAVFLALALCSSKGPCRARLLDYSTSADASGDRQRVVGYAAVALVREPSADRAAGNVPKGGKAMLSTENRSRLLTLARQTIGNHLAGKPLPSIATEEPSLREPRGVFVTLRKKGQLRGCIGFIMPMQPLIQAVRTMAIQSATEDPRFPPVTAGELKDIEIEISVLTVPEKVKSSDDIVLGRDGVIVKRGPRQGVFLPQVAEETGWSKEEFLGYLCSHKAGLPRDAWKDPDTELLTFQAEVFSERER